MYLVEPTPKRCGRNRPRVGIQEVLMLVPDTTTRRVDLIDKLWIIAMKFLRIDAHDWAFECSC